MGRTRSIYVGYARSTGEEEADGTTWKQQIEAIKDYAQGAGLSLAQIYYDSGIPGTARSHRSGIFTLLDEIPIRNTTDVIVARVDRLIRDGEIGRQILKELETHKISIHSLTEDESKVRQDTRRITASTVAALKSANTKIQALKRGKAPAGRAPYGYRREAVAGESTTKLVVVEEEAKAVQWIFREYLRRRSMAKVAKGLAERGIPAPGGKEWSRASVAWILGNEIYIGYVKFGNVKNKGEHEPIIGAVVFHKVQRLRHTNRRMRKKKGEAAGAAVGAAVGAGDESGDAHDPFAAFDRRVEREQVQRALAEHDGDGAEGDGDSDDPNADRDIDEAVADAPDDTVAYVASGDESGDEDFVFEPIVKPDQDEEEEPTR